MITITAQHYHERHGGTGAAARVLLDHDVPEGSPEFTRLPKHFRSTQKSNHLKDEFVYYYFYCILFFYSFLISIYNSILNINDHSM